MEVRVQGGVCRKQKGGTRKSNGDSPAARRRGCSLNPGASCSPPPSSPPGANETLSSAPILCKAAAHWRLHAWACQSILSSGSVSESGRPEGRAASIIRERALSSSRWTGLGPTAAAAGEGEDDEEVGVEGVEEAGGAWCWWWRVTE